MELSITHTDIFTIGICLLNLHRTTILLMNLDVDTLDKAFGNNICFKMQVMSRMCMLAIIVTYFRQCNDWLCRQFIIIVITTARDKTKRNYTQESEHKAHIFKIFHFC